MSDNLENSYEDYQHKQELIRSQLEKNEITLEEFVTYSNGHLLHVLSAIFISIKDIQKNINNNSF